ncbi:hypothetical protein GCM10009608_27520 [Pseudonocardia alaniniphila]
MRIAAGIIGAGFVVVVMGRFHRPRSPWALRCAPERGVGNAPPGGVTGRMIDAAVGRQTDGENAETPVM